jgi:hypothetical protein
VAKVFDFLHSTNELLQKRGIALPLPPQGTTSPDTRAEQGLVVQKQIAAYGRKPSRSPSSFAVRCSAPMRNLYDPIALCDDTVGFQEVSESPQYRARIRLIKQYEAAYYGASNISALSKASSSAVSN